MLVTYSFFRFSSGGLVFWADAVGPSHIYNCLKKWSNLYGNFFKPSRFLEERVSKGLLLVRALSHFLILSCLFLRFNLLHQF